MTSVADSFISITRSPLKPAANQCLVNISPSSNLSFSPINQRKAKLSSFRRPPITVQASGDAERQSSSSFFVGGFVLGVVVGALGSVYTPKIVEAVAGVYKKEVLGKLPKLIDNEEPALESTEKNVRVTGGSQRHKNIRDVLINEGKAFWNESPRDGKTNFKLSLGSVYLPKDNKSKGEDAHFLSEEKCTMGIADGVRGWAKQGIDPGVYARELMSNSAKAIRNRFWGSGVVNPEEVLRNAYSKTKAQGSSTACIITLKDKCLHAVNVGDSGFIIIREGQTIYKSPVQQRTFNYPYQLGNHEESDRPSSAEVIKVAVELGDVIVAGTDGLFDNIFIPDIEETVNQGIRDGVEPQEVASRLAKRALHNSQDAYKVIPFRIAAMESGSPIQPGGKINDITVIVSYIMH